MILQRRSGGHIWYSTIPSLDKHLTVEHHDVSHMSSSDNQSSDTESFPPQRNPMNYSNARFETVPERVERREDSQTATVGDLKPPPQKVSKGSPGSQMLAASALTHLKPGYQDHAAQEESDEFKIPLRFTKSGRKRATPFTLKVSIVTYPAWPKRTEQCTHVLSSYLYSLCRCFPTRRAIISSRGYRTESPLLSCAPRPLRLRFSPSSSNRPSTPVSHASCIDGAFSVIYVAQRREPSSIPCSSVTDLISLNK